MISEEGKRTAFFISDMNKASHSLRHAMEILERLHGQAPDGGWLRSSLQGVMNKVSSAKDDLNSIGRG